MDKKLIEDIERFDGGFPDGVYAVPMTSKVKVRSLYEYCKEIGVSPDALNDEEIQRFVERIEKSE
ncbi:hypothetical protein [Oceanobacillus kimchii]|uniref:hypothetical protein n=1 Tax=Oceanobacillus kimchii TaxID=746691 RepID=UPI003B024460